MFDLFARSFKGQASLAAAFWLVYVVFSFIIWFILVTLFKYTAANFTLEGYAPTIKAIMFPYILFSAICVWRCGKNSWILWNILAKIIMIIAVLAGIYYVLQVLHIAQ